jgi:hypothetical protein
VLPLFKQAASGSTKPIDPLILTLRGQRVILDADLAELYDVQTKALKVARKTNGYAEGYLKGHRKLPKNSPGSYSPGSRESAGAGLARSAETSGEVAGSL